MQYFLKNLDYPISLAIRGTRYEAKNININKVFLGALIGFSRKIFEKINGYPNNMYGWGGEDDAIANRLMNNNFNKIYYPKIGNIIDFEEMSSGKTINIQTKLKITDKEMVKYEKMNEDLKSWNINGINSLDYKELQKTIINDNTTQYKVDLLKSNDEKKYPHLFNIKPNNYEKLKNKVYREMRKLKVTYI